MSCPTCAALVAHTAADGAWCSPECLRDAGIDPDRLESDGATIAGLFLALRVIRDTRLPAPLRLHEAERLARTAYRRPLAPQRLRAYKTAILAELRARALVSDSTVADELVRATATALFLVDLPGDLARWPRLARAAINREVTRDLIEDGVSAEADMELADPRPEVGITSGQLDALLAAAGVSDRDAMLLRTAADGYGAIADAADRLGITPGAARVALHRARSRLRASAGM